MSGRYQHLDTDEERLPEGVTRTGYDADEQRYYYSDADGRVLVGEEGNRYGRLHEVGRAHDTSSMRQSVRDNERETWRYLLPSLLLVGLFLLGVWKIVTMHAAPTVQCDAGASELAQVQKGDTCWKIAQAHQIEVDDLKAINMNLDCDHLLPGDQICVPKS